MHDDACSSAWICPRSSASGCGMVGASGCGMVDTVGHRYELTTIDEFEYIDPIDNSTSVAQVPTKSHTARAVAAL